VVTTAVGDLRCAIAVRSSDRRAPGRADVSRLSGEEVTEMRWRTFVLGLLAGVAMAVAGVAAVAQHAADPSGPAAPAALGALKGPGGPPDPGPIG
jgi:hypothetical protein